jgi:hypothetical protein
MNNKTTVVLATVVFALVGTLVFASIVPYLSDASGKQKRVMTCPPPTGDMDGPPCGPPAKRIGPPGPRDR